MYTSIDVNTQIKVALENLNTGQFAFTVNGVKMTEISEPFYVTFGGHDFVYKGSEWVHDAISCPNPSCA